MLISDWSSDGCSSDLSRLLRDPLHHLPGRVEKLDTRLASRSDLQQHAGPAVLVGELDNRLFRRLADKQPLGPGAAIRLRIGAHFFANAIAPRFIGDRKSTRLNSSH